MSSPYINRFLQPDTLIPGVDSPQSWNRFSYVSNNPVRFNDPTGHMQENDDDGGVGPAPSGTSGNNGNGGNGGGGGDPHDDDDADVDLPAGYSTGVYCDASGCHTDGATYISWTLEDWPTMLVAGGAACLGTGLCVPAATSVVITGTNTVYQVVQNGKTIYVGITQNFPQRAAYWLNKNGWDITPIQGLFENLSRSDARAVEQVLIEHHGLGNLANQINSIAATNPIYQAAIQRGNEILQIIGFGK